MTFEELRIEVDASAYEANGEIEASVWIDSDPEPSLHYASDTLVSILVSIARDLGEDVD